MTTGDAYLFDRLGGFSGGVLLDEPLLPASSLTRNTRNAVTLPAVWLGFGVGTLTGGASC